MDQYDVLFHINESERWSASFANGSFSTIIDGENFLYLADNALLYWFNGNIVNTANGGITGGLTGIVNEAVLRFPSYINIKDVAETRGRMYMGIQTSDKTIVSDDRTFSSSRIGMYIWDRRSTVVGAQDFYPAPGAKEVKAVFTSSGGDVKMITTNNTGFSEIRAISNGQYKVVHTFEKDGYPSTRNCITESGPVTSWIGLNGTIYGYGSIATGEPERLYKLGNNADEGNSDYTPLALFTGHTEASEGRVGTFISWTDSDPSYVLQKWYPFGDGTIDGLAQNPEQGDVFTKVYPLPSFSTVHRIRGFHLPGATTGSSSVATVKFYFNQSTTVGATQSITLDVNEKGFFEKEISLPNVTFIQAEIEWDETTTIGADTYRPMYFEVEYDEMKRGSR